MSGAVTMDADTGRSGSAAIRVFILDDHELLRRGLREFLTDAGGFEVVGESSSAREAARRMPALRPDVALLDVRLPDGSGVEVCRHVRTRDPSIRALMVTSFDDPDARLAAAVAGASGFLLKQINGDEVVDAVRRVARGESLINRVATAEEMRRAATAGRDPRFATLTGQEARILYLIADGLTNYQIGIRLRISEKTVKSHVTRLLAKLGLANRTQAAVLAVRPRDRPGGAHAVGEHECPVGSRPPRLAVRCAARSEHRHPASARPGTDRRPP